MRTTAVALLWLAAANCASGDGVSRRAADRAGATDVLYRVDLEESSAANAFELLRLMKPHWLRRDGPSSVLNETDVVSYVDGVRLGGPQELRQVAVGEISSIRYYSALAATARWGFNHVHGAIEVVTGPY